MLAIWSNADAARRLNFGDTVYYTKLRPYKLPCLTLSCSSKLWNSDTRCAYVWTPFCRGVANIVDGDSSIAASFNFHSARDLSSTVNIILGQMELSSVGMQISVDPNVISSIVGDLENVIASWGRVDKKRIAEIIGRIEALVTR